MDHQKFYEKQEDEKEASSSSYEEESFNNKIESARAVVDVEITKPQIKSNLKGMSKIQDEERWNKSNSREGSQKIQSFDTGLLQQENFNLEEISRKYTAFEKVPMTIDIESQKNTIIQNDEIGMLNSRRSVTPQVENLKTSFKPNNSEKDRNSAYENKEIINTIAESQADKSSLVYHDS